MVFYFCCTRHIGVAGRRLTSLFTTTVVVVDVVGVWLWGGGLSRVGELFSIPCCEGGKGPVESQVTTTTFGT